MSDLTLTDAALTPEQTRQLAAILTEVDLAGETIPDEKQWPEILARASEVLTPLQLATLKRQADRAEQQAAVATLPKLLREQAR